MHFSVQWAGVTVAYVGMMIGAAGGWKAAADAALPLRISAALAGTLLGGGAALPFMAGNFVAALLTLWLARGYAFATQFATFAALSLALGWLILKMLDEGLRMMGGLHLATEMPKYAAAALTTLAIALFLMRLAPTGRAA